MVRSSALASRFVPTLALLSSLGLCAPPAAAQDQQALQQARAKFQQAVELEQAKNYPAAVQLFRQVGQVRMTPQVRFHIAICEDKLGRLVAALGGYELALRDADSVGPDFRAEVEANAARLRERIPKLVIQRGAGADAAQVELDGSALGDSAIGVEVPVDPGPHTVTAKAPGYKPFESTVTLADSDHQTVELVLEAQPGDSDNRLPPPPPPKQLPIVPIVVGGVGAASLVASGVLFALRQGELSDLQSKCTGHSCPPSAANEYDRFKVYHYSAFATLGVGLAALGTAATLFVLETKSEKQSAVVVAPLLGPGIAGTTLHARF